jgi:hypothetical protein
LAIEIRAEELSPAEYFRISPELLSDGGGTDRVRLLWTRVPACGVRPVLAIPPNGYCWGMQFVPTAAMTEWRLQTRGMKAAFLAMFSELGLDPYRVPETLARRTYYFGQDQGDAPTTAPDLPHAWFRSEFLPDSPRPLEDFVRRLATHIAQLGKFFFIARPEGGIHGDVSAWANTLDSNLERLFGSDYDEDLWGYGGSPRRRIEALEEALRAVPREDAETWLTPSFLGAGFAYPEYPMAETPPAYMYKGTFRTTFAARSPEDVYRDRMTLSLLRVKLLRKWRWPLGMKFLHERHESMRSRGNTVDGLPPWPALEDEVADALKEARSAYPVLFEGLNLYEWAHRQSRWW